MVLASCLFSKTKINQIFCRHNSYISIRNYIGASSIHIANQEKPYGVSAKRFSNKASMKSTNVQFSISSGTLDDSQRDLMKIYDIPKAKTKCKSWFAYV